jgi:hypothetical protein
VEKEVIDEEGNVVKVAVNRIARNYLDEPVDPIKPIAAVIRMRNPRKMPEPVMDEEGKEIPQ